MYFWVNQGKTFKEEKEGGYLWAPFQNSTGKSFFHWKNMTRLQLGDIVFNYRKGFLVGYCEVESEPYNAAQPEEFNVDVEWEKNGYMVDARYYLFKRPLDLDTIYKEIRHLLPDKYAPINASGHKVMANQGYLYTLSQEIAERITQITGLYFLTNEETTDQLEEESEKYNVPDSTTKKELVTTRIGQGEFRRRVLKRWKYQCAVNGSSIKEVLIASHIVPWREATNEERLDVNNAILLSPTYDALFDRNLISFDDDGKIILSKSISEEEFRNLGITGNEEIKNLDSGNKKYLKRHRDKLYGI